MDKNQEELIKSIYEKTNVPRKPLSGIVKGYHMIPYVLVGPDTEKKPGSIRLNGEITVSPKMIYSLNPIEEKFEEVFEEDEPFMDQSIVSRSFSYGVFSKGMRQDMSIKGSKLSVQKFKESGEKIMDKVINELIKQEEIKTGVIWCPNPKFYPVSLERFIISILDKEFN